MQSSRSGAPWVWGHQSGAPGTMTSPERRVPCWDLFHRELESVSSDPESGPGDPGAIQGLQLGGEGDPGFGPNGAGLEVEMGELQAPDSAPA